MIENPFVQKPPGTASKSNGDLWQPPAGGLDVPHPRTASDILLRTGIIHIFAALAYAHLFYLLGFRKPHGVSSLPLLLVPAFLLLPELLPLQLCFIILPVLIAKPYRQRVVDRFRYLPRELGVVTDGSRKTTRLGRLGLHAVFGACNAFPFAAVIGAYQQRLKMRYNQFTYVANLGLDHRNGWVAISGLVAVAVTECVVAGLAAVVAGGRTDSGPVARAVRDDVDDVELDGADAEGGPVSDKQKKRVGLLARVDWSAVWEMVYVSGVHQFILAATNHVVPVVLMIKAWYIWPPVAAAALYLYSRRKVGKEMLLFQAAMLLIVGTMASQLWGDVKELHDVQSGRYHLWNFRWQVRDRISPSFKVD